MEGSSKNLCNMSINEAGLGAGCLPFPLYFVTPYLIGLLCSFLSISDKQWKKYDFNSSFMGDRAFAVLGNYLLASTEKLNCII